MNYYKWACFSGGVVKGVEVLLPVVTLQSYMLISTSSASDTQDKRNIVQQMGKTKVQSGTFLRFH